MNDLSLIHEKKIAKLQAQLIHSKHPVTLHNHRSNTLRGNDYKQFLQKVDLSLFNQILHIDTDFALVEPSVTVSDLCKATLKKGLIPKVVPEFPSITVGGAINGCALESSSFKYGQFNDTCLEYEVILGCGTLLNLSKDSHPDLFYALSGSYGTFALLTLVKICLIPAKKYVHLTYHKFSKLSELLTFFAHKQTSDFLEAIAFDKEQFIAIDGIMTDNPTVPIYHHRTQWFASHALIAKEEAMPLKKYLFRFDRGAFWMGYHILSWPLLLRVLTRFQLKSIKISPLKMQKPPFFVAPYFTTKHLYKLWHRVPKKIKEYIFFIQDFYIPRSNVECFFNTIVNDVGIFPLWLCPIKATSTDQFLSPHQGKEDFVNIGVYGVPRKTDAIPEITASMEKKILEVGGKKMLYSLTYYDKETFSILTHDEEYQKLRKKFHAEKAFPTLYNKVVTHDPENLRVERPSHPK